MKSGPDALAPTSAGDLEDRFQLTSEPVDLGGGLRMAAVHDVRTTRAFTLWIVPPSLVVDAGKMRFLESRVAASISLRDRRMLNAYGVHASAAGIAVRTESSRHPRLTDAGPLKELRGAGLPATVQWLHDVAEALTAAVGHPGLAHGAVSPFWIHRTPEGAPRLDGAAFAAAFADAGASRAEDRWFHSPARRRKEAPNPTDDVFGFAALTFWALAGGGRTEELPRDGIQAGALESLRKSRGLPPTGWPRGWDELIVAGLSATASVRPAVPSLIGARLKALLPQAPGVSSAQAPVKQSLGRRPPPWRDLTRWQAGSLTAGIADRKSPASQVDEEVTKARAALAAGIKENALQRAKLEAELAAVARTSSEVEAARRKLDDVDRDLGVRLHGVQDRERALGDREQAVAARNTSFAAREASAIERETAVTAKQQALDSLQEELQRRMASLEQSGKDLAEAQGHLDARRQELDRSETEVSERRAQLALELQNLDRSRENLEFEAKRLQSEQQGRQSGDDGATRSSAELTAREQAVAAREQDLMRSEAEFAAKRERLVGEKADLDRRVLENKAIVDAAKSAESRVEAARAEQAAITQDLAVRRADLASFEETIKRREAAAGEREKALQGRDGESAQRAAQVEQLKAEAAKAARENERERTSITEARRELERERHANVQKAEVQAREQKAWEESKQTQQQALAAAQAEVEAAAKAEKLRRSEAAKGAPATSAEPASPAPAGSRPASRVWPLAAVAAIATVLVLGFLLFRTSGEFANLRKAAEGAANKTSLVVVTDPSDAEVSIEGRPKQPAPARFEGLPPGSVEIKVSKAGYVESRQTVTIKAGETLVTPPVVLRPPTLAPTGTATLLVRTNPSGAVVSLSLQGVESQRTPWLFKNLSAGVPFKMTVSLDKYDTIQSDLQLKPNEVAVPPELTLKLTPPKPVLGGVSVTTKPADAEVEINGQIVMRLPGVPATRGNLPPGPVKIVVKKKDFLPSEQTVDVKAGETTLVPLVELKPEPKPVAPPVVEAPKTVPLRAVVLQADFNTQPGTAIKLVRIEQGEITIAPESSGVRITRPFLMATTEITQSQFETVMKKNPSARFEKRTKGEDRVKKTSKTEMRGGVPVQIPVEEKIPGDVKVEPYRNHPVEKVTWEEAMEFCRKLTEQEKARIPSGAVFRLPTEGEWWLAVNANQAANSAGWFAETAKGEHRDVPALAAAGGNVQDLFGNVAEWCLDAWSEKLPEPGSIDPLTVDNSLRTLLGSTINGYAIRSVTEAGSRHVINGGSFKDARGKMFRRAGSGAADDVGFRVVLGYPVGNLKSE